MTGNKNIYYLRKPYRILFLVGGSLLFAATVYTYYKNKDTIFTNLPFWSSCVLMFIVCVMIILYAVLYRIVVTDVFIEKRNLFKKSKLSWKHIKEIKLPFTDKNRGDRLVIVSDNGKKMTINGIDFIYILDDIDKIDKGEPISKCKQSEISHVDKIMKKELIKIDCVYLLWYLLTLSAAFFGTLFFGQIAANFIRINIKILGGAIFYLIFFIVWKLLGKLKSLWEKQRARQNE